MKSSWRMIWYGVIAATVLLVYGTWVIYNDMRAQMLTRIMQKHSIALSYIHDFEQNEKSLIAMLAEHPKIGSFSNQERRDTEAFFSDILKAHTEIMQLRFIDTSGNEQVRLDRLPNGTLKSFSSDELQNKADRYYFKAFMKLSKGSIGFSEFDLNIEHGKLDIPFNPTLRVGMPVYENGKKIGLVVINFYMQRWIEHLLRFTRDELMLVDQNGYFLIHPDKKWEWSRYQTPQKKAAEYFDVSEKTLAYEDTVPYRWINHETIALPLNLFGQKLVALYHPNESVLKLFIQRNLRFAFIVLIAAVLIVIPFVMMIRLYIRRIDAEKVKIKEGKAYLSTLFNSVFDAVIVIDKEGIIQRINHQALKLFGYRHEELIGKNVNVLIPEPHRSLHNGYLSEYIKKEKTMIDTERNLKALRQDGTLVSISLIVTQMRVADKIFFIGTIRDLTRIEELEKREHSNQMMLVHQSKLAAMGEMLGAIAHQWRQPLNSIGLIIQDLLWAFENNDLDKRYFKKCQTDIMGQLQYMSQTIDEFRNFFKQEHTAVSSNLIEIMAEIRQMYRSQLVASNIVLQVRYEHSLNADNFCNIEDRNFFSIVTYPSELKQVLLNLISNAKEAVETLPSEEKAIRNKIIVTVIARVETIRIEVHDDVGGLDEETSERIFEPYFTTKEQGTGLGLYICKMLCERYLKADLTFFAEKEETTFILTLPRKIEVAID